MEQITSAIIAAIVGFITARLTRYTDITTKSRIDWIQRVREISIEFINSIENSQNGVISQVPKTKNNKLLNKLKMHLNLHKEIVKTDAKTKSSELLNKLKMYLNPCEEIDKEIIDTANHCLSDPNLIDKFEEQIQAYLKAEWERVKYESKCKKYDDYMFALKYNECRIRINGNYTNESIKNIGYYYKFKKFTYISNIIFNFLFQLVALIFMGLVIVVFFITLHT